MGREQQAEGLRGDIARLEQRGRGRRYPEAVQQRAVEYYWARRVEGAAVAEIGPELGLSWKTVHRWAKDRPKPTMNALTSSAGFEQVQLLEAPRAASRASITVKGPRGLCIEGLDLDMLAELLRRLS